MLSKDLEKFIYLFIIADLFSFYFVVRLSVNLMYCLIYDKSSKYVKCECISENTDRIKARPYQINRIKMVWVIRNKKKEKKKELREIEICQVFFLSQWGNIMLSLHNVLCTRCSTSILPAYIQIICDMWQSIFELDVYPNLVKNSRSRFLMHNNTSWYAIHLLFALTHPYVDV